MILTLKIFRRRKPGLLLSGEWLWALQVLYWAFEKPWTIMKYFIIFLVGVWDFHERASLKILSMFVWENFLSSSLSSEYVISIFSSFFHSNYTKLCQQSSSVSKFINFPNKFGTLLTVMQYSFKTSKPRQRRLSVLTTTKILELNGSSDISILRFLN